MIINDKQIIEDRIKNITCAKSYIHLDMNDFNAILRVSDSITLAENEYANLSAETFERLSDEIKPYIADAAIIVANIAIINDYTLLMSDVNSILKLLKKSNADVIWGVQKENNDTNEQKTRISIFMGYKKEKQETV